MNLLDLIDLQFGGPGSGCNPDVGQCGRPQGSGNKGGGVAAPAGPASLPWKRFRDQAGVQNQFVLKMNGRRISIDRESSPTRLGKFRWVLKVDQVAVGKPYFKNAQAAREFFEKRATKYAPPAAPIPGQPVGFVPNRHAGPPSQDEGPRPFGAVVHSDSPLAKMSVTKDRELGGGMMGTYKLTMEDGSRAVWKPVSGEKDAGRRGVKPGTYYLREALAYDVAKIAGLTDMVPETVVREYKGEVGSAQRWIPGENAYQVLRVGRKWEFNDDEVNRAAAFDYVIMNTDRHGKNYKIDVQPIGDVGKTVGHIKLIDHGLAFSHKKAWRVSEILNRAASHPQAMIPDSIKNSWAGKWDQIADVAKVRGLPEKQITAMQERYQYLLTANTWRDLEKDWEQHDR